ncbi:MAG TPA: gluconokinase, GntK/IdnK-type [Anaeromyxobacter sp.]|nr:gluconokinase, GntK/IdnK-type [Anaeromyxobacter sp.]
MISCLVATPGAPLSDHALRAALAEALGRLGPRRRVLLVPPDVTRRRSFAGRITELAWELLGDQVADVLPALGTHLPMTGQELSGMFGRVPHGLFRVHRFREDVETLGRIPAEEVRELSGGRLDYDWPAQVNRLVARGGHDLVLCVGQVVPHEVAGVAGGSKMLLVGTGGPEAIHRSHYLGAVHGMERLMGRAQNPVRSLFDRAMERFATHLPVAYVLTVVGTGASGAPELLGLYVGDDHDTFARAAAHSLEVNVNLLDEPPRKVVVHLDAAEYRSTWVGNKAIYRTRMAIADGGELLVLAPGVRAFGEDPEIDRLIRAHGYRTTPEILERVRNTPALQASLGAAAHLIHGSPEGRFTVTYAAGGLGREEIEGVGFRHAELAEATRRYDPRALRDGWNTLADGERVFYVSHPGAGLWAHRPRFTMGHGTARTSILLVMGVSGSGKTTVGSLLAGRLGWRYAEADDFHPPANVAKMAAGRPLDDEDRLPWLQAIAAFIDARVAEGQPAVVTCSALRRSYRDLLRRPQVRMVYLRGDRELVARRLADRRGHFFRPELLESQFETLEEPGPDEGVLAVPIAGSPASIAEAVLSALGEAG